MLELTSPVGKILILKSSIVAISENIERFSGKTAIFVHGSDKPFIILEDYATVCAQYKS